MEFKLRHTYKATYIIVEAQNVKLEEDMTEYISGQADKGNEKTDTDISDEHMFKMTETLNMIALVRKREFNSFQLMQRLFELLPENEKTKLLEELNSIPV